MEIKKNLSPKEVTSVGRLVSRDFRLDLDLTMSDLDLLKEHVTAIVREMLDSRFDRLLHALYRIDVDEADFKRVLSQAAPDSVASEIAELILVREFEKVISRQKHQ